jgi:hypothetical protein
MGSKYLRYRASKIANAKGITKEEAMVIAKGEVRSDKRAAKQAKIEKIKEASKRLTKKLKRNNSKTTYMVGDRVVVSVVSAGAPGLGKRK